MPEPLAYQRKKARNRAIEADQSSYTVYNPNTGKQITRSTGLDPTGLYSFDTPRPKTDNVLSSVQLTEPTVLSSMNGRDRYERNVQPIIDKANQVQQVANERRQKESERTQEPLQEIPSDILYENESPVARAQRLQQESLLRQQQQAESVYNDLTIAIDRNAQAQIGVLNAQWNQRRRQLEQSNKSNLALTSSYLQRTGASEYSPLIAGDFLTAKEQKGIEELQDLDMQYTSAIGAVNAAADEKNFSAAANLSATLQDLESQALKQIQQNAEDAQAVNDAMRERESLITRQNAIIDLYDQGITDPGELLDYLNFTESGELVGDVSLEEIQDTLKIIQTGGVDLTGTSADLRTFSFLYPELKPGTPEYRQKYNTFIATQAALKRKPGGSDDGIDISTSAKTRLLGAGFTAEDIPYIVEDVNAYGLSAVLENVEDEVQKNALRDVYGASDQQRVTQEQIEQNVDFSIRTGEIDPIDILKANYSDEELRTKAEEAGFAGWFGLSDAELEDYLDSTKGRTEAQSVYTELLVDQYRSSGLLEE